MNRCSVCGRECERLGEAHYCGGTPTYSTWPKGLTEADVRRIVREELTAMKAEEHGQAVSQRLGLQEVQG